MDKRTGRQIVNDVINFIIKDLEKQDPNKTYTVAEFIEGLKELLLEENNDDTLKEAYECLERRPEKGKDAKAVYSKTQQRTAFQRQ